MVDHMVVSKSSGGEKFLVLIVYDSFSGIIMHVLRFHRVQILYMHFCRSDAPPELIKAIYVIWDGSRKPRCLISQDVSA